MGSTAVLTVPEVHSELDEICLRQLILTQDLVNAKLKLEQFTKAGNMSLAKSRYTMGGANSVSALQLPTEEWADFESRSKVEKSECLRSEYNVRFNYFSLTQQETKPKESKDTETINRTTKVEEKGAPTKDPLKWFGILVPSSLRDAQRHYTRALELSIECANLQSEIQGVIARKKYLDRMLAKSTKDI